jgi:hypothetical protein
VAPFATNHWPDSFGPNAGEVMPKTLNKGNKGMVGQLFAAADPESCKTYTLANGFIGQSCPLDQPRLALVQLHRSKLVEEDDGTYTVQVHSNLWYNFGKKK